MGVAPVLPPESFPKMRQPFEWSASRSLHAPIRRHITALIPLRLQRAAFNYAGPTNHPELSADGHCAHQHGGSAIGSRH